MFLYILCPISQIWAVLRLISDFTINLSRLYQDRLRQSVCSDRGNRATIQLRSNYALPAHCRQSMPNIHPSKRSARENGF